MIYKELPVVDGQVVVDDYCGTQTSVETHDLFVLHRFPRKPMVKFGQQSRPLRCNSLPQARSVHPRPNSIPHTHIQTRRLFDGNFEPGGCLIAVACI